MKLKIVNFVINFYIPNQLYEYLKIKVKIFQILQKENQTYYLKSKLLF